MHQPLAPLIPPLGYLLAAAASSLQTAADGVLALSYGAIAAILLYLAVRKPDLPFRRTFALVGAFLLAGGVVHLFSAAGPGPWDEPVRVVAGLLAAVAVISLVPVPRGALSLRSPIELERAQRLIEEQIAERRQAEERLVLAAGFPNQNPHPLVETDSAGKPTFLNLAAKQAFPDLDPSGVEHPILEGLASLARAFRWGEQESITREIAHGASVFRQTICYLEKRDRLLIYMVDITELKQQHESLRRSEEEYRAMFEQAPVAYQEFDPEGTVWRVNEALCALFGYNSAEIVGKPVWQFVAPEQRDACRHYMLGRASGRESLVPYVVECIRKDRVHILVEIHERFIKSPQGVVVGSRCALFDVTERRSGEEALRRGKEAAEEAARAGREFTAGIGDQIRTSLDEIIAKADRSLRSGLPAEPSRHVAACKASAAALRDLVSDVRDFCAMEAGALELDLVEFSLREGVGEAVTALALRAREKGLDLAYRVAPDVPDRLIGDLGRLRQILLHLAGNAVQFTEQGEVVVEVETGTQMRKGEVGLHFRVTDTGAGIAREHQARIFDAFRHAPSATLRQGGGAGLGLAICSRLAGRMGGRLWVDSEPKKGSAFHFTLLLACPERTGEGIFPPRIEELERLPALVVDSHPTTRRILEEILESWRMKVQTADSAASALAAILQAAEQRAPFRVVLLDARLSDREGLAVAQQIWKHPELGNPKVLLMVEEGRPEEEAHYLEAGADDCVTKPVRYYRLWSAIAGAFGKPVPAAAPVRPIGPQEAPRKPSSDPAELSFDAARERADRADRMAARIMAAARSTKTTARGD